MINRQAELHDDKQAQEVRPHCYNLFAFDCFLPLLARRERERAFCPFIISFYLSFHSVISLPLEFVLFIMSSHRAVQLYRSLLRAHKQFLPANMRALGDTYVKAEFQLHKTASEEQAAAFLEEWTKYLHHVQQQGQRLRNQASLSQVGNLDNTNNHSDKRSSSSFAGAGGASFGQDLPSNVQLTDEQQEQLAKLRQEASNLSKK